MMCQNAVFDAVYWAVYRAVNGAVGGAVGRVVDQAGWRAVSGAVLDARREDPDHPALQDFLCAVGGVR